MKLNRAIPVPGSQPRQQRPKPSDRAYTPSQQPRVVVDASCARVSVDSKNAYAGHTQHGRIRKKKIHPTAQQLSHGTGDHGRSSPFVETGKERVTKHKSINAARTPIHSRVPTGSQPAPATIAPPSTVHPTR